MDVTTPGTNDVRRFVVSASLVFAVLLTAGAVVLLRVRGVAIVSVFDTARWWAHAGIGVAVGATAGSVCGWVVSRARPLARLRRLAHDAVDGIEPRWHTILAVAIAAGASEEFFFRGALEPAVGRWVGAVGFVALHGALRIRDRGGMVFALFLFAASLGLSWLRSWRGLECAMAAHAAYDAAVLAWLVRGSRRALLTRRPL